MELKPAKPGNRNRTLQRDLPAVRLNGRNARFLDIDEALSGSDSVAAASPSSARVRYPGPYGRSCPLLSFVAEAAGVARLAGRRNRPKRVGPRYTMERLQDIHEELQRQLDGWLRSEAAERYNELSRRPEPEPHPGPRTARSRERQLNWAGRNSSWLRQRGLKETATSRRTCASDAVAG